MREHEASTDEKQRVWLLVERILGRTEPIVNYRPDWRVHRESSTAVLVTFSRPAQLFYDVSQKDLAASSEFHRAFVIFVLGSHRDTLIVPSGDLRREIESSGCVASKEYGDYKLHLVRDASGAHFREVPSFHLAKFQNQYSLLL
jgi:hypothetical protein